MKLKSWLRISACAFLTCTMLTDVSFADLQARRKSKPNKVADEQKAIPAYPENEEEQETEFSRLLMKYLENADIILQRAETETTERHLVLLEECRQKGSDLSRDEVKVLKSLRAKVQREGRRLFTSEGPEEEVQYVIPTSESAARVFTTLVEEDGVALMQLASLLHKDAYLLDQAWVPLLESIVLDGKCDEKAKRYALLSLYKSGMRKDEYRTVLTNWAEEKGDVQALDALLFTCSPDTGGVLPIISPDNLGLMKRLATVDHAPEIRVTCASYACEIRDYDLAQTVCEELLLEPFRGMANTNAAPPDEDYPLARARLLALELMFYGLRNERMFRLIYDRARIVHSELRDHPPAPPAETGSALADGVDKWVSFGSYVLGRMEVNHARSLLSIVEHISRSADE